MGIYSELAKNAYLESGNLCDKKTEDYYKSKMFFGYAQVLIDAESESEAKLFQARAINDFDIFCKCYKVDDGDKLNGIVLKPVGESSNMFIACTTSITGDKSFEKIVISEGKVISAHKNTITVEKCDSCESEAPVEKTKEEPKEKPKQEEVKEEVNLARDF